MANNGNGLLKEPFCSIPISFLAQPRINQIAIMINGSLKIAPFPMDLDGGLIDIPGSSCLSVPFCAQLIRKQGGKSCLPIANCLIRKREAAFEEHQSRDRANLLDSVVARGQRGEPRLWEIRGS